MFIDTLKALFTRDLNRLKREILAYDDEKLIWKTTTEAPNSAGNLCLHLIGNLHHFIGSVIGKTGYVRQRELEFSLKDVPSTELASKIEDTIVMIEQSLSQLDESTLEAEYPLLVFKEKTSVEFFLMHLSTHLNYHLGQVNYHRRLLSGTAI